MMIAYGGLAALFAIIFFTLPSSFLPAEDQGVAQVQYNLPPGATQVRSMAATRQIEHYYLSREKRNMNTVFLVVGGNQAGTGQNAGRGFISFAPWDERKGKENSVETVNQRATRALSAQRDLQFYALNPPPVRGLGQSAGFTMELLNSTGLPRDQFIAIRDK